MTNLRKKTRIETQYMVNAMLGKSGHTKKEIKAMILNISMDGALIETAEELRCRSLVLVNTHNDQTVSIHAKIIHRQDVPQAERVFGPFKTGLHFLNDTVGAREFIISIIKSQESDAPMEMADQTPDWMNTDQINVALFSTDSFEESADLVDALAEIPDFAKSIKEDELTDFEHETWAMPPEETMDGNGTEYKPMTSFKETVEQTLSERSSKEKKGQSVKKIGPVLITLFAFIVLLGSLFIFRTPGDKGSASLTTKLGIDIPFFGERPVVNLPAMPEPLPESTLPPARLLQNTIAGSVVHNESLGPLFVIRGYIKLEPGHRPEEVTIRGKLLNGSKDIVDSMSIWPGNSMDDRKIEGLNKDDLMRVRNYTPEKGYQTRTPFIMVFQDIPGDTRSFAVDLTFQTF